MGFSTNVEILVGNKKSKTFSTEPFSKKGLNNNTEPKLLETFKMNLISPNILEQIELEKRYLEKIPEFNLVRKKRAYCFLQLNANRHSANMEVPNIPNIKRKLARRRALSSLLTAQKYLCNNFDGNLQEELIKKTAAKINYYQHASVPYRESRAMTTNIDGRILIYPDEVKKEMDDFIEENNSLESFLEKAVHAHFHLTRIHPFHDGNGRLARLTQNAILDFKGFPPIIIQPFERLEYLYLIHKATWEYKGNEGCLKPAQATFYNYLALKLRDSIVETKKQIIRNGFKNN